MAVPELAVKLNFLPRGAAKPAHVDESAINSSTKFYFNSFAVRTTVNRELRKPADGGSTKHIELDIRGTPVQVGPPYDPKGLFSILTTPLITRTPRST
jgi:hypothetical protein